MHVLRVNVMVQDPWGDGENKPINYEEQHLSGIPQQGMFPHGNQVFFRLHPQLQRSSELSSSFTA